MNRIDGPKWIQGLDGEDLSLARDFILASGSLKALSSDYGISYPTIRLKLDRLIDKIKRAEEEKDDGFEEMLKNLLLAGKLDSKTARLLLSAHEEGEK